MRSDRWTQRRKVAIAKKPWRSRQPQPEGITVAPYTAPRSPEVSHLREAYDAAGGWTRAFEVALQATLDRHLMMPLQDRLLARLRRTTVPIRQSDLAAQVGCTREQVCRQLRKLRDAGRIRTVRVHSGGGIPLTLRYEVIDE